MGITEKYYEFQKEQEANITSQNDSSKLFYMKQTISNACGTVALIHSLANNLDSVKVAEGSFSNFLAAAKDKTPAERAELLENDDAVCECHDAAAREGQTRAPDRDESVDFHFVAFVQVDGDLYELDGRKSGPLKLGKSSKESFLTDAAGACKEYMSRDPENINFTVVALTAKMD